MCLSKINSLVRFQKNEAYKTCIIFIFFIIGGRGINGLILSIPAYQEKKKIKILLILSPTLITGMLIMCQKNYIICILIWCKAKQLFAAVGQCTFTVVARYPNWDFTSWPVKDSFQFNATPHCSYNTHATITIDTFRFIF